MVSLQLHSNRETKLKMEKRRGSSNEETLLSPTEIILTGSEIRKFQELGLGRGIDATRLCFEGISSIQVREVMSNNVVETMAHASQECYEDDILSEQEYHVNVLASLEDPQGIVKCKTKANCRQGTTDRNKVIGYKIQTKRITFKEGFESHWEQTRDGVFSRSLSIESDKSLAMDLSTSEDKFYGAILRCIEQRQLCDKKANKRRNDKPVETLEGEDHATKLDEYFKNLDKGSAEMKEIEEICSYFVNRVRITHYVYDLELGAYENRMVNESQEQSNTSIGIKAAVKHVFKVGGGGGVQKGMATKALRVKTIGTVQGEQVTEEGVIGIEFKPMHTLLQRHPNIRTAMQSAIRAYIEQRWEEESQNTALGPFRISCSSVNIYWKVIDQSKLVGTDDSNDASWFYFVTNSDTDHKFAIATKIEGSFHFVKAMIPFGRNEGPLEVSEMVYKMKHKYLTLHKSDADKESVNVHKFGPVIRGSYYFKRAETSGYIAMEPREDTSRPQFITKCVRRKKYHNTREKKTILFQIHQKNMKLETRRVVDDGGSLEEIVDDEDDEETASNNAQPDGSDDEYLPDDSQLDFSDIFKLN